MVRFVSDAVADRVAVRLRAQREYPVEIDPAYDVAPDYYMVRDLDTLPAIVHADNLFEGIEDARR